MALSLLMTSVSLDAAHTTDRPIYTTTIKDVNNNPVFYFPSSLPLANRACISNADREITSSSVTSTELSFLSGVTSSVQTQLSSKEPTISAGTTSQYYRGDKTFQTLDKSAVGLSNVDNTSDVNKPVSTAQAASIATKKTDSMSTNKLLGRGTAGTGAIEEITLGTNLSLSGTTLNATGGGTPAGSNKQLQYNNSGAFGAVSTSTFDSSTSNLGINVASPLSAFHVKAGQSQIAAPTSLTITQTAELSNTTPSVSTSVTYGPDISDNTATISVSQSNGSGTYFADGSTNVSYNIYAVRSFNGQYYYRGNGQGVSVSDDSSFQNFTNVVSWTQVSNCDGYILTASGSANNGNPNFSIFISGNTTTSFNDDGNVSASDTLSTWDSIAYPYDSGGTAPAALSGSLSQSVTNDGSGSIGPADGSSYAYEVDTAVQINGVWYTSGSPISASATDNNNSNFFDWYLTGWSFNSGGETNLIIKRVKNSGTPEYSFASLNSDFTDTNFTNDSTAEAAWGVTYGGPPTTITRSYNAFGMGFSPSNSTQWFSSSGFPYTVTANNDVNGYVITHNVSQGSRGTSRILGDYYAVGDYSASFDTNLSTFIEGGGSNLWTGSNDVSLKHYGIQGSGQTKYYRLYANRSSPSQLYSASFLSGSSTLPNNGQYYTLSLSWTAGSGSPNTKILESNDGTNFNIGHLTGATSIVREISTPSFSSGVTVTPNSIDGNALIAENAASTDTDSAQIVAKSTSNTTAATKMEFQVADGSARASIGTLATTGNAFFKSNVGTIEFSTQAAGTIASLNAAVVEFNKSSNASGGFKIRSGNNPTFFDTDYSSQVRIGGSGFSLSNTPALGVVASTNNNSTLYLKARNGMSGYQINSLDSNGNTTFILGEDGKVSIKKATPGNAWLNVGGQSTSTPALILENGSLTTSPVVNAVENDGTNIWYTSSGGSRRRIPKLGVSTNLTANTVPITDASGNLIDSPLNTSSGVIFNFNSGYSYLFKDSVSTSSGKDISSNGKLFTATGTNTGTLSQVGGTIFSSFADVGNSTTTETDLVSNNFPANGFSADGQMIHATYFGTYVGSTSTKQLRVKFDGTTIFDSTALAVAATGNWKITVDCVRASSTTARCSTDFSSNNALGRQDAQYTAVTVANWTSTRVLKITGQAAGAGAATNDIVLKGSKVQWQP